MAAADATAARQRTGTAKERHCKRAAPPKRRLPGIARAAGHQHQAQFATSWQASDRGMAKSKKKAETIFLVCEESGDYNYALRRKPGGEKLKLNKYSPRLRKHTLHSEKKK
jgi:large subunit ribosomal protein L33